jgi:hypothetical protein
MQVQTVEVFHLQWQTESPRKREDVRDLMKKPAQHRQWLTGKVLPLTAELV